MPEINEKLTESLIENETIIKRIFNDDMTLIFRYVENQKNPLIQCGIFYIDGMVDNRIMNEDIIEPIQKFEFGFNSGVIDAISQKSVFAGEVKKTADIDEIVHSIVYGDTVVFAEKCAGAVIISSKGWQTRDITEPTNEKVLRGPREGFVESLIINLSMLRRRIKNRNLKMEYRTFGRRSKTQGCLCYIDGLANPKVVAEFKARLDKVDIDGVLDVNYIKEFIKDAPYSPIGTIGSTERPDAVAGKLLEGRIAFFLDGTPVVLTAPYLFIEHFQSDDDYYINYFFSSIGRILRILGFVITVSTPAVYIALTTFHQELLPLKLTLSIAQAREGVPFPTVLEAILMLIVFEILRETGMRAPSTIGQMLSIVGVLVIGQAAVDAKFVSAPIIIVISISGITGIMLPKIKGFIILLRTVLIILSSIIGLYGYIFGIMWFVMYLFTQRSFGIPVMNSNVVGNFQDNKDIFVRAPWWYMIKRPRFLSTDKKRSNTNMKTY